MFLVTRIDFSPVIAGARIAADFVAAELDRRRARIPPTAGRPSAQSQSGVIASETGAGGLTFAGKRLAGDLNEPR